MADKKNHPEPPDEEREEEDWEDKEEEKGGKKKEKKSPFAQAFKTEFGAVPAKKRFGSFLGRWTRRGLTLVVIFVGLGLVLRFCGGCGGSRLQESPPVRSSPGEISPEAPVPSSQSQNQEIEWLREKLKQRVEELQKLEQENEQLRRKLEELETLKASKTETTETEEKPPGWKPPSRVP